MRQNSCNTKQVDFEKSMKKVKSQNFTKSSKAQYTIQNDIPKKGVCVPCSVYSRAVRGGTFPPIKSQTHSLKL